MTELYVQDLLISGAPLGEQNPLPVFRDPNPNRSVHYQESVPEAKRAFAGFDTGYRVLPYAMQDNYTRQRRPLHFNAVILENDLLKATFLPALGGRLISLEYKPEARELLARNPVFQPANLALRNAWFSGGIEWNLGHYGHALTTASPVFAAEILSATDEPGLRLYDFERCKGLFWQIDFQLPTGSPFLIAYCRVINPSHTDTSIYWWNNTAVEERPDVRVLAPSLDVIYVDFAQAVQSYGYGTMPYLPTTEGRDASYATNFTFASEYFFQCEDVDLPWEAALDGDGKGLIEASTPPVNYRKMFCWGMHAGGRHWQNFLSEPGQAYLEIQSGMTPAQVNGVPLPANGRKEWVQAFGYFAGDPARVHDSDYARACAYVDGVLKQQMTVAHLDALLEAGRAAADSAPARIVAAASGWGALELMRRAADATLPPVPATFAFPASTLTDDQAKWLTLLHDGRFPQQDAAALPGEWLVQPEWLALLDPVANDNWFAHLHAGVMRMEGGDSAGAVAAWEKSIALQPSPWALRNLAVAAVRSGDEPAAQSYYAQAWALADALGVMVPALAVECLQALVAQRKYEAGLALYNALPDAMRDVDRIQVLRGRIALELGDLDTVAEVLTREFAVIREGETETSDLWWEMWARREAAQSGQPLDAALRKAVRARYPLPENINFLMFDEA